LSAARKNLSGLVVQKGRLENQEQTLQNELAVVELHLDEIEYDIEHLEGLAASYQQRKYHRLQVLDEFELSDELARAVGRSAEEIDYDDFFLLAARMQQEENVLVVRSRESLQQLRSAQKTERGLFEKQKVLHVNIQREQRELSEVLRRKRIQEQALREKERELRQKAIGLQAELLRVESVLASLSSETSPHRERLRESSTSNTVVQDRNRLRAQFRSEGLHTPVLGTVAQRFRNSRPGDPYRNGILFQVDESLQRKGVAAIADGVVTFRGRLPFFGESLIVEHGPDEFSLYGHVSQQTAELSQRIRQGEKIAELESDGRLYLELRKQGQSVDPQPLFRSEPKRG
jgi:septal ring factor EnvC (AmiA/AmiB activator)